MTAFVAITRRMALPVFALLALAACEDKRIRELDVGISKDSTLKILADGVPAVGDTIQNVYRHNQYLIEGKFFDIYFFDRNNRKLWADPLVEDKELTPIVVVNDTLNGWGWDHMDEVTYKYKIQVRADTLTARR